MKTVLITGANKGIGFEAARQLAKEGYFIYLGSRDEAKGLEAVRKLKELGLDNVEAIVIDVTNMDSVTQARQELEAKTGVLDILINNAGIAGEEHQELATGSMQNLRNIFDTNFLALYKPPGNFCRCCVKPAGRPLSMYPAKSAPLA